MFPGIADMLGWTGGMLLWCCKAYCVFTLHVLAVLSSAFLLDAVLERFIPSFRFRVESLEGTHNIVVYRLRW